MTHISINIKFFGLPGLPGNKIKRIQMTTVCANPGETTSTAAYSTQNLKVLSYFVSMYIPFQISS